jgi:hypothetical protein
MMKNNLVIFLFGQLFLTTICAEEVPEPVPYSYDFSHVNLAIRYFDEPSEMLLEEIASTTAAVHLKRHSDHTGYYPSSVTSRDITTDLLNKIPAPDTLVAVRKLIQFAEKNPARQQSCFAEASAYLPGEAQPKNPLHITWGYDIGVAMDDHASLNFTHPHFLNDRKEIWFYCIHEVHHSGVMQIHPMPQIISDIDTVQKLTDFIRYATFLEGLAVHAARDDRRKANALGQDRDYIALEDTEHLARLLTVYWQRLSFINREIGVPLSDVHWKVVEEMSSGDRLWYVAGAAMAAAIENSLGRAGLLEIIRQGPKAFFNAYEEVSGLQIEAIITKSAATVLE